MGKRVTNECIQRELGEIVVTLKHLHLDIEEIKKIAPRIRSLELFRSYIKGGFVVVSGLAVGVFSLFKGAFGHF